MTKSNLKSLTRILLVASLTLGAGAAWAQNMSHAHMGHVTDSWGDTPDEMGLLPTAMAEAEIAIFHATLAAQQLDNLAWMQTHANHVLHAVDATAIEAGPGLGYGVLAGAEGVAKHIIIAAESEDASENVEIHSVHVSTSANNTVARVAVIKANITTILAASTAADAAAATQDNLRLAGLLLAGFDANNDGVVDWTEGEGGLNEAHRHMEIMASGEDM